MNLGLADAKKYITDFVPRVAGVRDVQVAIAPQSALLSQLVEWTAGSPVEVAAQNGGTDRSGAYTGEISPSLLRELGVKWAIVGHSERRHVFGETDSVIQARVKALLKDGVKVILCVGETLEERKSDQTLKVVARQLQAVTGGLANESTGAFDFRDFAVAYEPVWAIGTGETATPAQAQAVHHFIRGWLAQNLSESRAQTIRIQYGGSVKPDNTESLMNETDIDGLLVGGASLKPDAFAEIVKNAVKSGTNWKKDKERQ